MVRRNNQSNSYSRPSSSSYTPSSSRSLYNNRDNDEYIINAIQEIDYSYMNVIDKLFKGIPIDAYNQINISLTKCSNLGHGGGVINGVIYGKIESVALDKGMKVKISGKYKRGLYIIDRLWSADGGNFPIRINRRWKSNYNRGSVGSSWTQKCVIILVVAIVLLFILSRIDFSFLNSPIIQIGFILVMLLLIARLLNINISRLLGNKMIMFIILLFLISFDVPGAMEIGTIVIMILGIGYLFKAIL